MLFENLPSDQAADKTTDESSNKQYRQNPVGHISHERVGIFLTVAGEQALVVSVTRHNDGNKRPDYPHGKNAVDQHFTLGVLVVTGFHHKIGNQPENQPGRDAPPAHAGQQHNDTEQHPADGKHTEFFDFGEEQHHRNTAHKRHDHADKRNENRDKTDGRRSENDDKINRRENTDVDEILSLQFVVHCETS